VTALPEGWTRRPLGEVAETLLGKMLDKGRPQGLAHVPYLRNVNVQWGRINVDDLRTMELADDERERFGVRAGDLLVCEGGEIGRAAIWPGRTEYIAYQKALHRVRPFRDVESRFLLHYFSFAAQTGSFDALATGSTIKHLPQQQLRRLMVPVPPLDEQRRIVDILEDHLSRLDAAESGLRVAAARTASLRAAFLDALFVEAPTGPLRTVVERVEAGRSFGGSAAPAREDQWGIIKVSAMTWGDFRAGENKAIDAALADARYEIHTGDLLVSRANTTAYVGAAVLVGATRPRLLLSDKSLRLVPVDGVRPEWLHLALSAPRVRSQISRRATGTKDSMRNIAQSALLSVDIPLVGQDRQIADIAAARVNEDARRDIGRQVDSAISHTGALRRALLAAAFSGRLTGRSSDLEIAEESVG